MKLKLVYKENLVKNAILLASLTILRLPIQNYIENSGLETHKDLAGYVLAAVSLSPFWQDLEVSDSNM